MKPKAAQTLFFFALLAGPLAYSGSLSDPFTEACNAFLDSVIRAITFSRNLPPGPARFKDEFKQLIEKHSLRSAPIRGDYLEQVHQEWSQLPDPEYQLTVLKVPVPEAAIETLYLALRNKMGDAEVSRLIERGSFRGGPELVLRWTQEILEHPQFKNPEVLKHFVDSYRSTVILTRDKVRYCTGIPVIPDPAKGHVRVYKGSNFFKGPARSQSQVGKPVEEVKDGGVYFLDQGDANTHSVRAEAFHPDGVSVSLDKTVPLNYGSHIRIYDIPSSIAERLPHGAPGLRELVFKYSVPERFRIMTLPKATYLEALKEAHKRESRIFEKVQSATLREGSVVVEYLKHESDPILIRGRSVLLSSLYTARAGVQEGYSVEMHTLMGFEQMERLSAQMRWFELQIPPNVDLQRTLKIAYALHDIGKSMSSELKLPHQEISAEILSQVMNRGLFSKAEVDLARALVHHDVIGGLLQGRFTPQEAFESLLEISRETNLKPRDFFRVQVFLFTADASAYPDLAYLFKTENGARVIKSEKFRVLENLFENVDLLR